MGAQHLPRGAHDVQLIQAQRLRELGDAHTDREPPLIQILRLESEERAIDQRVVTAQGLGQERQALELVSQLSTEWLQSLRELIAKALLFTAVPRFTHPEAQGDDRREAERADGEQEALRE